jgi:SAM-dependent methyltransferase
MSWVPPGVDTSKASIARVYDYILGGKHNVPADRETARALIAVQPDVPEIARANREFLARAVRFVAAAGVRQFLDIGSGIPTQGNVHEIAQRAAPGSRVAYVDIDPVAVAHSRSILAGQPDAGIVQADLRQPQAILASAEVRRLIDFGQPVGLLLGSVLHFLSDAEEPRRLVGTFRDALAPGSYLVISHAISEGLSGEDQSAIAEAYQSRVETGGGLRSQAEVGHFFDGFQLVEPGLVLITEWRPDAPAAAGGPVNFWFLAGVGRKP